MGKVNLCVRLLTTFNVAATGPLASASRLGTNSKGPGLNPPKLPGPLFSKLTGSCQAMTEQLEQLIQAAAQMADDDPRLAQARELIRLRIIAKLRQTYPNLDQANCANVIATVFENLENIVQWVNENGVHIANDEPVIRDALLSELRMVLCADQTRCTVAKAGSAAG